MAITSAEDGATKLIYPTLPKDFPAKAHVTPQIVLTKAADGLEIHNQLFLPKDLKPGERRPALVFVHGGPPRQMLPGYHYMQAYTWLYAFNQYLADQGYVVISINYRSGIGYGRSFQTAPGTMAAATLNIRTSWPARSISSRGQMWIPRASETLRDLVRRPSHRTGACPQLRHLRRRRGPRRCAPLWERTLRQLTRVRVVGHRVDR